MEVLNRGKSVERDGRWQIELCDDYEHIDDSIEYVIENVLQSTNTQSTSYLALHDQFNSFVAQNCNCETEPSTCTHTNCLHGGNYVIYEDDQTEHRELVLNVNRKSRDIIYECSDCCSCHPYCYNRVVQFGPRKHLKITNYSHIGKQFGLLTLKPIPKGSFVCEYAGEILSKEEAMERHKTNDENQYMNYIICLNERPIHSGTDEVCAVIQTFIDPSRIGNIGRYLNHSCDPNCEIISVRTDGIIPKLCIFTKEDIQSNTELCFDYGEDENKLLPSTRTTERKACYCGTEKCRKFLPNL